MNHKVPSGRERTERTGRTIGGIDIGIPYFTIKSLSDPSAHLF